jgi:hypothetical protein
MQRTNNLLKEAKQREQSTMIRPTLSRMDELKEKLAMPREIAKSDESVASSKSTKSDSIFRSARDTPLSPVMQRTNNLLKEAKQGEQSTMIRRALSRMDELKERLGKRDEK